MRVRRGKPWSLAGARDILGDNVTLTPADCCGPERAAHEKIRIAPVIPSDHLTVRPTAMDGYSGTRAQ